jgi:hypothetical protein
MGLLGAKRTTITVHRSEEILPPNRAGILDAGGGGGGRATPADGGGGGVAARGASLSSGEGGEGGGGGIGGVNVAVAGDGELSGEGSER